MTAPRWLPKKERLLQARFIRPFARYLDHPELWHLERESVARGAALGLFFGVLIPVAQFLFAAILAIFLRGNLAVAAAATLITNPLTVPPIYWAAYRVGQWLLSDRSADAVAVTQAVAGAIALSAERASEARGWLEGAWYWVTSAGAPLIVGLLTLAVVAGVAGYVVVQVGWSVGLVLRQRARTRLKAMAQERRRRKAQRSTRAVPVEPPTPMGSAGAEVAARPDHGTGPAPSPAQAAAPDQAIESQPPAR